MTTRTMTITEGLAEIRTLGKRIEKKREFVLQHIARQDSMKDPLERDGGSIEAIRRERQAISDLLEELVRIRSAIVAANSSKTVTVCGRTRTIADWLVWRRDASGIVGQSLAAIRSAVDGIRKQAQSKGIAVASGTPTSATDIIINVNEVELLKEIEDHEKVLGGLDAALSTQNALTTISV